MKRKAVLAAFALTMTAPAHAFIGAGPMMNPMTMVMPATMGIGGRMVPVSIGNMGRT